MIIFNAGVAPRTKGMTRPFHRLASYYYLKNNKKDQIEFAQFQKKIKKTKKEKRND